MQMKCLDKTAFTIYHQCLSYHVLVTLYIVSFIAHQTSPYYTHKNCLSSHSPVILSVILDRQQDFLV